MLGGGEGEHTVTGLLDVSRAHEVLTRDDMLGVAVRGASEG